MTILSNAIRNYIVHFRLIATKNSFKLPVSFTEKASSSPAGKCKTERERDKKPADRKQRHGHSMDQN